MTNESSAASPELRFAAIGKTVMRGRERIAICASANMAKRIANALNKHIPNSHGQ